MSCSCLFSHYQYDLGKNIAFVFDVSYVSVFAFLYSNTILATFSKIRLISLNEDPKTMNPKLSIDEKNVIKEQNFKTNLKFLLI